MGKHSLHARQRKKHIYKRVQVRVHRIKLPSGWLKKMFIWWVTWCDFIRREWINTCKVCVHRPNGWTVSYQHRQSKCIIKTAHFLSFFLFLFLSFFLSLSFLFLSFALFASLMSFLFFSSTGGVWLSCNGLNHCIHFGKWCVKEDGRERMCWLGERVKTRKRKRKRERERAVIQSVRAGTMRWKKTCLFPFLVCCLCHRSRLMSESRSVERNDRECNGKRRVKRDLERVKSDSTLWLAW